MKAWSNIEISPQDPEIVKIDKLEKNLGELPEKICRIRELITGFEVCHFKYQRHLVRIKNSIKKLEPYIELKAIGVHHIKNGEDAWKKDVTGRSFTGQQYIWAIKKWLGEDEVTSVYYDQKLGRQIREWLGDKSPDKVRLVRLLLARLTWEWESYEKFLHGGEYEDLEFHICRMDICHYAFPAHLDRVLRGIGQMKPAEKFEGCGSFDNNIKAFIENELSGLNKTLHSLLDNKKPDKDELTKAWLIACLAKTLKGQVNLSKPVIEFNLASP
jgi:hypothetical protein